ncbi:tRNA pseudouridine55 synthase [Deinobacterium chartae]|uniref:tRNA pseudouridine synthase B n=1 Tax=Deinobacterium chartae TaxID=521158 RepID=A0A841HYR7_9DEIO|nr:tRNA pseudouridine(55) synthase TruB [Deinobacterium chartae]MBB6098016.1 tRNA pseudouridine55 synthase [Deinobacterium chartae]
MPVYVIDKPLGLTSHDVVARARRALATRRVGHTGTLDPLATGVLVVCAEESTKLVQFLTADSKDYLAFVALGAGSRTLDAEGPLEEAPQVPLPSRERLEEVLSGFVGEQLQVPPQFSAISVGGVRAYDVARRGGALELPARPVSLHELRLLAVAQNPGQAAALRFAPTPDGRWDLDAAGRAFTLPAALGEFPVLVLWARVGSGTYLRSLARDLGEALGTRAHLTGLVRTRVGRFGLGQAVSLEQLSASAGLSDLEALDLPRFEADPQLARALRDGKRPATDLEGRYLITHAGALVAVADALGGQWKVVRAWAQS